MLMWEIPMVQLGGILTIGITIHFELLVKTILPHLLSSLNTKAIE